MSRLQLRGASTPAIAAGIILRMLAMLAIPAPALWEVSLALPYGWWGFQHRQMMGLFVGTWSGLAIRGSVCLDCRDLCHDHCF